jgi:hypothetical protein
MGRVLDLASEGLRLKRIVEEIIREAKIRGEKLTMTRGTVRNIIKRYVKFLLLFEHYINDGRSASNIWFIDDTPQMLRRRCESEKRDFRGKRRKIKPTYWIINILEANLRYWLAAVVTTNRNAEAYRLAISIALKRAKSGPVKIKCDKLSAQINGIRRILKHVEIDARSREEDFGYINLIERLHSTMRRWGIKKRGGFRPRDWLQCRADLVRLKYNYLHRHSALGGLTPARKAGVKCSSFLNFEELISFAYLYLTRVRRIWPFFRRYVYKV